MKNHVWWFFSCDILMEDTNELHSVIIIFTKLFKNFLSTRKNTIKTNNFIT